MNKRIKELAEQAGLFWQFSPAYEKCLKRFAELVRQDERDVIEKIIKRLRPEIVGTPNDPDSHQRWCDSAAALSRFESVIAAIRARGEKHE